MNMEEWLQTFFKTEPSSHKQEKGMTLEKWLQTLFNTETSSHNCSQEKGRVGADILKN